MCGPRHSFLHQDQRIQWHLCGQHHPSAGIQPKRYHHAYPALAPKSGRQPGLDLGELLLGPGGRCPWGLHEPGCQLHRKHHLQAPRKHDRLRDLCRQPSGPRHARGKHIQCKGVCTSANCVVNSAKALAPYRDTEGELGYKLRVAQDQLLDRSVPPRAPLREYCSRSRRSLRSSAKPRRLARSTRSSAIRSTTVPKRCSPEGSLKA